ncbi:helix-turn-helix transcriptional regulator [Georgenia sp. Marseille-Q6866]
MLELLSLLQLRREWPGSELAERLGVSDRTLRRDVDKLRELDYPVHAVKGKGGGYRLGDGGRLPPLQFLSDEAVAAAIALTTAASSNVHGVGEAAQRALGKLEQVLPSRLRTRVQRLGASVVHLPGPSLVEPEVLMTVAGACRDHVCLRFDYVRGDGTESLREVEPYGLVTWTGRWYLVAWDVHREDWRTFRVDRLRPRIPLGRRFTPRQLPGDDAGSYLLGRVRDLWQEKAVVLVHEPADSEVMRRWAGEGEVRPVDATSCRLLLDGDSVQWLASALAQLEADFVVESPEALRHHLREVSARLARAATAQTETSPVALSAE